MDDFRALFGCSPTVRAEAPGRINLIGEHTDYNGGLVLPTALPRRTIVELAPRADGRARVASADGAGAAAEYSLGAEQPGRGWLDFVQGCTAMLRRDGHGVGGFAARISSTVPIGAGLASSAALEVSFLRALRAAFGLALDDVALALVAHRAEHDFVGARVGVMDQMAASLADETSALLLDARTLAIERVALPAELTLVLVHSGIAHEHATGGYNARRAECEEARARLGVAALAELGAGDPRIAALPAPLARRVRHVVTENGRVRAAVAALRARDLDRLGALISASHLSLRDDYEVSLPAIDLLVELACADTAVHGARLVGGGFGGAVLVLARAGAAAALGERLTRAYERASGRRATVLVARAPGAPT